LPEELDAFERSLDESRPRFEGGIEAVRRLWTESEVVYEDAFYRFGPITSSPRPVQRPHPPIMIGAVGTPASFEWAGRQGHRLGAIPFLSKFEDSQENFRRYRDAFAAAWPDRPVPSVEMSVPMHVAETDEQAVAEATGPLEQYIAVFRESVEAWRGRSSTAYPGYEQLIGELEAMTMERILRERRALIGSPNTVERELRHLVDLFGEIEPSMQIMFGDMPFEAAERSLRLFATAVMPRLSRPIDRTPSSLTAH
jgi:alkanesulfonate monooxygenase SsuD/methylene tetrahydromethanopterin reductase-like flavin-dependent oxidoreductase (luciferase family)